ncbi:MAG: right-handed parallel beta-helix repeat-containing protein, partial [Candidatus Thermoplasmatota archaeon]|nr:right-handed parallel beta-helix repeat-containing protein [Candidatus Thermoplasmatota archaeon]
NVVNPGDTVYVRGGRYNEKAVMTRSGTSSKWITFKNYTSELPIVDGTGLSPTYWAGGMLQVSDASYIIIDGFKVQDSSASGIGVLRSSNVTVQNCQTYNTKKSGIRVCFGEGISPQKYCTYIKVLNNHIALANNNLPHPDQEALTFSGVSYSEIKGNTLTSSCIKEGICCKYNCNYCTIAYNNLATPDVSIYIGASYGGYAHDFWVYGNYCHGTGNSISIGMETCGLIENFYIFNNIFASDVHGFQLIDEMTEGGCSTGPKNVYFINNVCNVGNSAFKINPITTQTYMRNVVIRNNILKGDDYSIAISDDKQPMDQLTIDHNFFSGTPYPSIIAYGTSYLTGNPKWVNPSKDDYHLQSTSTAIDAGSSTDAPSEDYDGNLRPQGTAVDIGAYEYITKPNLECNGSINWKDVTPGSTKTGSLTIKNIGDPGTLLDWNITSYPGWGDWTFTPKSGEDLTPGDGIITVQVSVKTPNEKKKTFTGNIEITNRHDSNDKETILVSLTTPKNKTYINTFIQQLIQKLIYHFPIFEKILNQYYYN